MKNEMQSSVVFRVPDFIDVDGIEYTDIEVIVEMDRDIRDTVKFVKTLERPLTERRMGIHAGHGWLKIKNPKYTQAEGRQDMFRAFQRRGSHGSL